MTERDVIPFPIDDDDREIAGRLAALYEQTPTPDSAQVDRCVRNVLAESMHMSRRGLTTSVRPQWWWGAAAAAALLVVVARPWRALEKSGPAAPTTVPELLQGTVTPVAGDAVRFEVRLPTDAREVALVGDFNDWNEAANPMAQQSANGSWTTKVPLAPGRHVYAFVVDGKRWLVDPMAPQVPDDGLGPANAVVIEGLPK